MSNRTGTGPTGPTGATGLSSGIVFASSILNPGNLASFYYPPVGSGDVTIGGTWVAFGQTAISMPQACVFNTMIVTASPIPGNQGSGDSITVTLYQNGTATSLSASANSGTGASGVVTTGNVSVAFADQIALQASGPGLLSGQGTIQVSLRCQ